LMDYSSSAQLGGYRPSDFAAARISQDELEKLVSKIQQLN